MMSLLAVLATAASASAQQRFTFANVTFNQLDTPDHAATLPAATYSGAIVTAVPTSTGSFTGFPTSTANYDSSKSIGRLLGGSTGTRYINLPQGNNGTTARSGLTLSWNSGRALGNAPGDDFVIYESASTSTGVEAFMVQVYIVETDTWSSWRYEPADSYQPYVPSVPTGEGGTATLYDLSDFGLSDTQTVAMFRIVNMTNEDRMVDVSGYGDVIPEDNGATSSNLPNPGPLGGGATSFASGSLDPDPFYLGVLQCGDGEVDSETGEECDPGDDVSGDCCTAACRFETDATSCDDADACSTGDQCTSGVCAGTPMVCDDGNSCTVDSCSAGSCVYDDSTTDGQGCDDGEYCTVGDTCAAGSCAGSARDCSDASECTLDSCDEAGDACLHDAASLEGSSCGTSSLCMTPGTCTSGSCDSAPVDCGDSNPCTADSCNEIDGCVNDPAPADGSSCDDGAFCTVNDTCSAGTCTGIADTCDDANECTADSCDEVDDACIHDTASVDGSACGVASPCTGPGTCSAGSCSGTPVDCDDSNDCTTDSCDEGSGCLHDGAPNDGSSCDDGQYCTVSDTCSAGACTGAARDCADTNECTADACDEAGDACTHLGAPNDGMPCTDADACTQDSVCSAGSCGRGTAVEVCGDTMICGAEECDDGNAAERDGCSSDCETEHEQSAAQQSCLTGLNSAGAKVAKIQDKAGVGCLKSGSAGTEADAQACVTADASGKVGKAGAKTDSVETSRCTTPPDFGETDATLINDAAVDGEVALLADLFGSDLGAAAIDKAADAAGAACQLAVAKSATKLAGSERKTFVKCKKDGLASLQVVSRATLRECLDVALDDTAGKNAKLRAKIGDALAKKCGGVDLGAALPGGCGSAMAPESCIATAVGCRVCEELDVIDALGATCCP